MTFQLRPDTTHRFCNLLRDDCLGICTRLNCALYRWASGAALDLVIERNRTLRSSCLTNKRRRNLSRNFHCSCLVILISYYLSTSPKTISKVPRIVTKSAK